MIPGFLVIDLVVFGVGFYFRFICWKDLFLVTLSFFGVLYIDVDTHSRIVSTITLYFYFSIVSFFSDE